MKLFYWIPSDKRRHSRNAQNNDVITFGLFIAQFYFFISELMAQSRVNKHGIFFDTANFRFSPQKC